MGFSTILAMFVDPGVYLVDWLARPQTELVPSQARQRKDDGLLMMIVDDWDVFFVFFFSSQKFP